MTIRHLDADDPEDGARKFEARLERYYRENYRALVRRHLRLGTVDQVQDAIQKVFMRIYERYISEDLEDIKNLDAYINTAVRHALLDGLTPPKAVSIEDEGGEDGWDGLRPQYQKYITPEDAKAWKQILTYIFDGLPAKYVDVATMVMRGDTPEEIGDAYGQDGYTLRRYTRSLICDRLKELADGGDPLAAAIRRDFCKSKDPKKPIG